jgi:hypothetical protein
MLIRLLSRLCDIKNSFARASFFFFLIACLLIGLALPALEDASARAAPSLSRYHL